MTVTKNWDVVIDIPEENKKLILESYKAIIDSMADMRDVREHIAYSYCILGCTDFIEGIGDLKEAGIKVTINYDDVDYEDDDCDAEVD